MNNTGNIERLKVWRALADGLRRSHMNHERRRAKMFLLSGIMKTHMAHVFDRDMLEYGNRT